MTPDLGNALFELGGAVFIWFNVLRIWRDQMVRGVVLWVTVFYTAWGVWNLYYYPAIGQMLSFWAGLGVVTGNLAWVVLAIRFRGR